MVAHRAPEVQRSSVELHATFDRGPGRPLRVVLGYLGIHRCGMVQPVLLHLRTGLSLYPRVAFTVVLVDEEAVLALAAPLAHVLLAIEAKVRALRAFPLGIYEVPQLAIVALFGRPALRAERNALIAKLAVVV